jgi:hypothetical protein
MEKRNPEGRSFTPLSLCPKVKLQVPPLRYATVGMTKWRAAAYLGMGGGGWTESTNLPTLSIDYLMQSTPTRFIRWLGQLCGAVGSQDELG